MSRPDASMEKIILLVRRGIWIGTVGVGEVMKNSWLLLALGLITAAGLAGWVAPVFPLSARERPWSDARVEVRAALPSRPDREDQVGEAGPTRDIADPTLSHEILELARELRSDDAGRDGLGRAEEDVIVAEVFELLRDPDLEWRVGGRPWTGEVPSEGNPTRPE
jgi:hypothetical protein